MNTLKFLKENVKPATGCTEPIAVAYAASIAYNAIHKNKPPNYNKNIPKPKIEKLEKITVQTDRDVYKNAAAIIVPNSNSQKGIPIAAAMGIYTNPEKELNLLENLNSETLEKANKILKKNKVKVKEPIRDEKESNLEINVKIKYKTKKNKIQTSKAKLKYRHNNIDQIKLNGEKIYEGTFTPKNKDEETLPKTIKELIEIAENINEEERKEIQKGIKMNEKVAQSGLESNYGLGVGKKLQKLINEGYLSNSLENKIKLTASAAADARMGGINKSVMSSSGSGNQGITATLPIKVAADERNIEQEKLEEAVMLSHLITKYVSERTGHLSAICGAASKAGIGTTAGLTYLLGGNPQQINNAINIMAANIIGIICDGAKEGCALKISTATTQALESALLSLKGMEVPKDNGIVHEKAENTIEAIGKISKAMTQTDKSIIDIMQNK